MRIKYRNAPLNKFSKIAFLTNRNAYCPNGYFEDYHDLDIIHLGLRDNDIKGQLDVKSSTLIKIPGS